MQEENEEVRENKLFYDLTLIFAIAFVGLFIYLLTMLWAERGEYVRVTVDNGEPMYYSLDFDGNYSLNGGTNTLIVSDGKASIARADCPDKVCEHSGKISKVGERIVCLPNRVYVEIVSERSE